MVRLGLWALALLLAQWSYAVAEQPLHGRNTITADRGAPTVLQQPSSTPVLRVEAATPDKPACDAAGIALLLADEPDAHVGSRNFDGHWQVICPLASVEKGFDACAPPRVRAAGL